MVTEISECCSPEASMTPYDFSAEGRHIGRSRYNKIEDWDHIVLNLYRSSYARPSGFDIYDSRQELWVRKYVCRSDKLEADKAQCFSLGGQSLGVISVRSRMKGLLTCSSAVAPLPL